MESGFTRAIHWWPFPRPAACSIQTRAEIILPAAPHYNHRIAQCYDALGWLYTGGQLTRLKQAQLGDLAPGSRVLYAGVGTGEELPAALKAGLRATALDSSAAMLKRAQRRLGAAHTEVEFRCESVFEHHPSQPYDAVVANFFLNVFSPSIMPKVLHRLAGFLRSGGVILIGDFAPPAGRWFERLMQYLYYLLPLVVFRLLTSNAWHPLYDYRVVAKRLGLVLVGVDPVRVFRRGPSWLCTLRFSKVAHGRR